MDPGGEVDRILGVAAEAEVEIEKVLLTHGHDHVGGTAELAGAFEGRTRTRRPGVFPL